ncbi:MAG: aromatic hydrocarbon degradation protein [Tannerella sp.]|jgi:long-subunit fatty acid transport protein|nr:aromatic hydrocarbon degradation protein [Tannerella sp.]
MKKTKKIMLTGLACCLCVSGVFAGGLLTNTNQSVHFLRNPARSASFEIDAVYTNPAGLVKLPNNGFHFSLNNQSAFQTRTITSTLPAFVGYGGSDAKAFKGKATALFIPSLLGAYKSDRWVISFNVGAIGGGGTLTFDKGLPSFESQIAGPVAQLSGAANIPTSYSLNSKLEGSSFIYGVQLGASYMINDHFSAYIGGRANIVNNGYVGYLNNVTLSAGRGILTYFNTAAATARGVSASLQPVIDGGMGNIPISNLGLPAAQLAQMAAALNIPESQLGAMPVSTVQGAFNSVASQAEGAAAGVTQLTGTNLEVDTKQSGFGITPIIGFNFNYEKLNIGVKYEFNTKLELENDTKVNSTPVTDFNDKVKTPYDIPAILTIGAQYEIVPNVSVMGGYTHYFDSNAKMANDKQKHINGGINEFQLGAEWKLNKMFLVSAGGQVTRTGVTDAYQSDLSFSLNSYSIGFGGAIKVSESVRINLAYFFTNYEDWTKGIDPALSSSINSQRDIFSRTNKAFGIGVDFRF